MILNQKFGTIFRAWTVIHRRPSVDTLDDGNVV